MGEIYKITNKINGKSYIGKTKFKALVRWKDHVTGYHPNSAIHKAIVKYGVTNFSFEVLEINVDEDSLNEWEMYYIKLYNSKSPNGYNLTDGGDGGLGMVITDDWRRKQSECRKGIPWSENRKKAGQKKLKNNTNACKSVCMIKDGVILKIFESASVASECTGIYRTNISRACKNPTLKAGGFYWKYV